MAGVRFIIFGGFLYALRRWQNDPAPKAAEWRSAAVTGILLLVGGNGGVVWAEQFVSSSLAALLVATVPLWMVLLDMFGPTSHRPGVTVASGILIGFGGVVLLIRSPADGAGEMHFFGVSALLFASLSWASGSLYGRTAVLPASPLLGRGMEMLSGGLALLAVSLLAGEWSGFDPSAVSQRSALAVIYLTLIGSSAFVAYVWLLRVAPTPLVATYAYVNPLVAVLLGYFLAHEPFTPRILLAAALIIGSVVLVSLPIYTSGTEH